MEKKFLSLREQVALIQERGLDVGDVGEAEKLLHSLNYYRVSGYGRQFQMAPGRGDERFAPGTSLSRIRELIALDEDMRVLLLEALSRVEIDVRSRFAHEAGRAHGNRAFYLDSSSYKDITPELPQHIAKLCRELSRPKLKTVERYKRGDDLSGVPVWVAIELITFGALAKMIWYLEDDSVAHATADATGVQRAGFASTIHSFAVMRNVCAHHGQLWHRKVDIMTRTLPKEKRTALKHDRQSIYACIVALKRFMSKIAPASGWAQRVESLLAQDEEYTAGICFPAPQ